MYEAGRAAEYRQTKSGGVYPPVHGRQARRKTKEIIRRPANPSINCGRGVGCRPGGEQSRTTRTARTAGRKKGRLQQAGERAKASCLSTKELHQEVCRAIGRAAHLFLIFGSRGRFPPI